MAEIKCSNCNKQMLIDEPGSEAYITDGLVIEYGVDGEIISIDDSQKRIKCTDC